MHVGQDTTLGDGRHGNHLVKLLVVADCELDMARLDSLFLGLEGGIASQFNDLTA